VEQLVDAGFIQLCRYAEWVSNIVPVEKKNTGKIWVCIDGSGHRVIRFLDGNAGIIKSLWPKRTCPKWLFVVPVYLNGLL
jgi:hypothetical protein